MRPACDPGSWQRGHGRDGHATSNFESRILKLRRRRTTLDPGPSTLDASKASLMPISFEKKVVIPKDVLVNELQGESVLLNLDNENYYGLDEVGTRMWALLKESESIQQAYDQLLEEYEVDPDLLRKDMEELIGKLVDEGLVEIG